MRVRGDRFTARSRRVPDQPRPAVGTPRRVHRLGGEGLARCPLGERLVEDADGAALRRHLDDHPLCRPTVRAAQHVHRPPRRRVRRLAFDRPLRHSVTQAAASSRPAVDHPAIPGDPRLAPSALRVTTVGDPLPAAQETAAVLGDMMRLEAIRGVQQSRTDTDRQHHPQHIHHTSLAHRHRSWPGLGV